MPQQVGFAIEKVEDAASRLRPLRNRAEPSLRGCPLPVPDSGLLPHRIGQVMHLAGTAGVQVDFLRVHHGAGSLLLHDRSPLLSAVCLSPGEIASAPVRWRAM